MSSTAVPVAAAHRARRGMRRTEKLLRHTVGQGSPTVTGPAADTLAAGGKRLRPLLVFCCAPDGGQGMDNLVRAAASVEMVHMATLVHDDILDGAVLRRGVPTVVARKGRDAAVQVGDFLFAQSFAVIAETGDADAIRRLADTAVDLSRGELAQQRAEADLGLTDEAYFARATQKTASLFATACYLGARFGGANPEVSERMARFGTGVGLAFQIFDDILDFTGSQDATGKPRGADLRDGTVTLPMILAMRHEPALARAIGDAHDGIDIDAVCDRLADHPGTDEARQIALDLVAQSRAVLDAPLDGINPRPLAAIADGVVDRYA